jgi:hypothetical protein
VDNTSTPSASTNTGGGGGGTIANPTTGLFNPALYAPFTGTPPSYITPTYTTQAPFQAPSLSEAGNQPGYQFGLQQGEQALQQSAAAQGLLRTGGTLKDILSYGQNAANQNYSNVLNQDLGVYNTNTQSQFTAPNAAAAANAANQNTFNTNQYTTAGDLWFNNANSAFSKYLSLAQLGQQTA